LTVLGHLQGHGATTRSVVKSIACSNGRRHMSDLTHHEPTFQRT
jgi:hypothetical protein